MADRVDLTRRQIVKFILSLPLTPRSKGDLESVGPLDLPWSSIKFIAERHDVGLAKEQLIGFDICVREMLRPFDDKSSARDLLDARNTRGQPLFQEGVLDVLATNNTSVAFVDLPLSTLPEVETVVYDIFRFFGTAIGIAPGLAATESVIKDIVKKMSSSRPSEFDEGREGLFAITRRRLLQVGGLTLAAWGLANIFSRTLVAQTLIDNPAGSGELTKYASEFTAFTSRLHPEEIDVYLRNALVSIKIFDVIEAWSRSHNGKKPNVAVVYGGAHADIARQLVEGLESCYAMLNIYPPSFWGLLAQTRGGIDKIAESTLIDTSAYASQIPLYPEAISSEGLKSYINSKLEQ